MNDRDPNVDCCQLGRDCVDELKNIKIYIIFKINHKLTYNCNNEKLSNSYIVILLVIELNYENV